MVMLGVCGLVFVGFLLYLVGKLDIECVVYLM